jgi:O-methyltransferase
MYRKALTVKYLLTRDRGAAVRFLAAGAPLARLRMLARFATITNQVRGYHTMAEMLEIAGAILARRRPLVVECGVGLGASTAKLSVAAAAAGGRLVACDSFRGIPANEEQGRHLDGRPALFRRRAFRGRLATVERHLASWGEPVVELRKGWFADTLPGLAGPFDVVVLDVDLVSSTRTCLVHLFPRLAAGGVLFTQDGHLEGVVALLGDAGFWRGEVGVEPPAIAGLGRTKLLRIGCGGR